MDRIGEIIWFDNQHWEIADHMNGCYLLWRDNKKINYGWIGNKPDPECPFFEGWVPARYLEKKKLEYTPNRSGAAPRKHWSLIAREVQEARRILNASLAQELAYQYFMGKHSKDMPDAERNNLHIQTEKYITDPDVYGPFVAVAEFWLDNNPLKVDVNPLK